MTARAAEEPGIDLRAGRAAESHPRETIGGRERTVVEIPTEHGLSRLTIDSAPEQRAVLWLGHGAGGGIEARDLAALASRLPQRGVTVARYEQPWRVAGKRIASRPAALDAAWLQTLPVVSELADGMPLLCGGRSAGARVACRTAAQTGAAGVVCLAFPLHPPGAPEKSRLSELLEPEVPVLVLQGGRDTFGGAELVAAEVRGVEGIRVIEVPDGDHSFATRKSSGWSAERVEDLVTESVFAFAEGVLAARD
ncbi:alpha/beta family hydrolase [Ruicaihuangia caeni]|uniref:Hydrolase n=1 Tax=Ruicaihuangia caeni TaxID=3042517 RepID=A0AAW6TC90_9MICO|nr:alpha/beta family hydrolase [Klugiella sp. YN-L-19]MDI2099625.1 hydrolase [Klugiella sp. YN-L-19]